MSCEYCSILRGRVRKLLAFVQSTLKLRLLDRSPLDKWIHESAPVALLGDACHPMLVSYALRIRSTFRPHRSMHYSHIERKAPQRRWKTELCSATFFPEFLTALS